MQADLLYQLISPLVFLVFALGFFAIHRIRTDISALLIGVSYIVGASAFVSDLIFAQSEDILIRTGIAGLYALTTVLIVGGCNIYYRKDAPWRTLGAMLAIHLALYATLLVLKLDWIRSIQVNFGCGLIFFYGLVRIRRYMTGWLDKLLFVVGVVNCSMCLLRPISIALMATELTAAAHDESTFLMTLQLFIAVSAIFTAMSMFLVLGRDVLEEVQMRSDTDPLTALFNRRGLFRRTSAFFTRSAQAPVCIIIADIDRFKQVNDVYGHSAGDDVICAISAVLKENLPEAALAARLGGEEFLTVLPDTDLIEANQIANMLRQIFEATCTPNAEDIIRCTASFGVAQGRTGETLDELIIRADRALYLAKNDGRNCVRGEHDLAIRKLQTMHQELSRHTRPTDGQTAPTLAGKRV